MELLRWPFSPKSTPQPRLVMTLLVKNEEEKLAHNLEFHHRMGVDAFIVTDNNSTDSTPDIIRRYREKGWIVDAIEEKGTDYQQKKWVDRMIQLARHKHRADWIINADADEFWYAPSGSLKTEMRHTRCRTLRCKVREMYPEQDKPFHQWTKCTGTVPSIEDYGLSTYCMFLRKTEKVAHRSDGYLQIAMGNHRAKMLPNRKGESEIVVYHYNIGTQQQFVQKMINGGRQLEQRRSKHGGRHWRYFYQLYKEGRLEQEYERVIGLNCYERLVSEGHIFEDGVLARFWNEHPLPSAT